MIERASILELDISEIPEDIFFCFLDERQIKSKDLLCIKMMLRRLGSELILNINESILKENWKNENQIQQYKTDKLKLLYDRQKKDFDLIVEEFRIDENITSIKYSVMTKSDKPEMVMDLADVIYNGSKKLAVYYNLL
ncbi:MAG: hypothetical protein ACM3MI_09700 [Clostridiales bacterium]